MLKNFRPRLYQETILDTCTKSNTLVVLPTGLGKTMVALMMTVQRLKQYPQSKILFLAPTKPLVEQHISTFKKHLDLDDDKFAVFTGSVPPEKRAKLWKDAQIFFSTPQGLENDVISERIRLEDVSMIIFDEAHRAVGEYAYVFIAKQYEKKALRPRILALTASPGADKTKIEEVCQNLYIEDIELRIEDDPDVKEYVQEMNIEWAKVKLPEEMIKIQKFLHACFKSKLSEVKGYGYINQSRQEISKTELLKLQGLLHVHIAQGDRSTEVMRSVSLVAEAMKVQHALELLETQGIAPLHEYLMKLEKDSITSRVKAVQNLVRDTNFKTAKILTSKMADSGTEHPKMAELKRIVTGEVTKKDVKIIIFNQFRDTASKIISELSAIPGVAPKLFVGQAKKKKTGMSQKEQKQMIEDFKNGGFNCLVATSVAEEGLDIPSVDLVIFYEPVPSGIRTIQRRGRTGRQDKGRVIVLVTQGTRDEGYKWSAHHKEKRMKRTILEMKKRFSLSYKRPSPPKKISPSAATNSLDRYLVPETDIKVFVDHREKGSGIVKELIDMGIKIDLQKLEVGDYLLSGRCGVEYKKIPDFVDSIIDGRLLSQIKTLKSQYDRPLILLEGEEDIYAQRKIHPNAIRGMMSTIAVAYGIPIIQTKDYRETAAFLAIIAKREQEETSNVFNAHGSRKPISVKEQQEYIVSALPNVGTPTARQLLKKFGSVLGVMNAPTTELTSTERLGEKRAKEIQKVLTWKYEEL